MSLEDDCIYSYKSNNIVEMVPLSKSNCSTGCSVVARSDLTLDDLCNLYLRNGFDPVKRLQNSFN